MAKSTDPHVEILTRRLRLRRFEAYDLEGLHACFGDEESMRYWNFPVVGTQAESARWVRILAKSTSPFEYLAWAVANRRTDTCVGMVNYHHREARNHRLEVGYILAPAFRGRGLMTEAMRGLLAHCFDVLNTHRVEAMIDPRNKPSIRLAERLGFRREGGPLRDRFRVGEAYTSALVFGLLAGELKAGR